MNKRWLSVYKNEPALIIAVALLLFISILMLQSLTPEIFPQYYLYVFLGIVVFVFFSQVDFDILTIFYSHFYVLSLILLIFPLAIGQITRGVYRWVQVGTYSFQPTEIVRPFIVLFFAQFLSQKKITRVLLFKTAVLAAFPLFLILIQPSLGVTVLTFFGIIGVLLTLDYDKKMLYWAILAGIGLTPFAWFLLADYQKERLIGLITAGSDPTGSGYNKIQSMIAVGSGELTGRGLGEGVQTQLAFLPERHTDFIFASIAEEFGFLGTILIILIIFFILYRIVVLIEKSKNSVARAFVSGIFLAFFIQVLVHIGMNMGIMPITGLPLPLVSAGGSSLIATMASLGMVINTKSKPSLS